MKSLIYPFNSKVTLLYCLPDLIMAQKQALAEKVIKGSFIVLALTFLGSVFAYLIRILFSRNLTIDDYGLFYAILGLVSLIATYMDLGFGYSVVYLFPKHFKAQNYSKAWNVFIHAHSITTLVSLICCGGLVLLAPFLANNYFKVPGSENLIYLFSIYFLCYVILNSLTQLFSSMHKELYYSSITVSKWFFTLLISGIFILSGNTKIVFLVIALIVGHALTVFMFIFLFLINYKFLYFNKISWQKPLFSQMFFLAIPSITETLVYTGLTAVDTFLLTLFRGVRDVGIYNIIYPVASIPIVLFNPINALILPLVSSLMEGERDKLKSLIEKILEIVPFLSLYFSLFTILFPTAIVGLIFGAKWQGLVEIPLMILSVGAIPILVSGILGGVALGMGRIKQKLKLVSITAIIFICVNIFLTFNLGIIGTVISGSAAAFVLCILFIKIINTQVKVNIPLTFYLKLLLLSLLSVLFIQFIKIAPDNLVELIIFGAIYTMIYILNGFILKVYNKSIFIKLLPASYFKK